MEKKKKRKTIPVPDLESMRDDYRQFFDLREKLRQRMLEDIKTILSAILGRRRDRMLDVSGCFGDEIPGKYEWPDYGAQLFVLDRYGLTDGGVLKADGRCVGGPADYCFYEATLSFDEVDAIHDLLLIVAERLNSGAWAVDSGFRVTDPAKETPDD